jgi:hypothetical protein
MINYRDFLLFLMTTILFFGSYVQSPDRNIQRSLPLLPRPKVDIKLWYGLEQEFGKLGNPQKQINILGNIDSNCDSLTAYFILNDNPEKQFLSLGCDLHRLAETGDFNIEIERVDLTIGRNIIHLYVVWEDKILADEEIIVNYTQNNQWPLPYSIKWNEVKNIQDVAQIVDGHWELAENGIRTKQVYYDRILAFGDSTWRNYEVETTVTFHGYSPLQKGPPIYNVVHAAIASRWPGHAQDDLQPNRKWFPLGATSEFRLTSDYDSCRWRIFDGEHFHVEQARDFYREINPEIAYKMKHRVEQIERNKSIYSVKLWKTNEPEPNEWDLQAIEIQEKRETGSVCIIAHNTDVTFGDITVIPVGKQ